MFSRVYRSIASQWFLIFCSLLIFLDYGFPSQNIAVALKFPSASMKINSSELPQKSSEQCIHSSGISSMRRSGEDVGIDQEKKGEDREEHKNKLKSAILSVKGLPGFILNFNFELLGFTFLFITEATTDQMLSLLFKQFPGFQRVRTDWRNRSSFSPVSMCCRGNNCIIRAAGISFERYSYYGN